jgi:hypothetical protein
MAQTGSDIITVRDYKWNKVVREQNRKLEEEITKE